MNTSCLEDLMIMGVTWNCHYRIVSSIPYQMCALILLLVDSKRYLYQI